MKRLLVHVEGEAEETFVNVVLAPSLYDCGFESVRARLIGKARERDRRGGIAAWTEVRCEIVRRLKEDGGCAATTMVDYYGLPEDWPGRTAAAGTPANKAGIIENALLADLSQKMDARFNPARFVPYVAMHEFEAMLFSDCQRFAQGIGHPDLASEFQGIRASFATPEEIDDSRATAPSKRIECLMHKYKKPKYKKPLFGMLAAQAIGLPRIRSECPHFADWLDRLERLPRTRR